MGTLQPHSTSRTITQSETKTQEVDNLLALAGKQPTQLMTVAPYRRQRASALSDGDRQRADDSASERCRLSANCPQQRILKGFACVDPHDTGRTTTECSLDHCLKDSRQRGGSFPTQWFRAQPLVPRFSEDATER